MLIARLNNEASSISGKIPYVIATFSGAEKELAINISSKGQNGNNERGGTAKGVRNALRRAAICD